jgi:hypothetical protein
MLTRISESQEKERIFRLCGLGVAKVQPAPPQNLLAALLAFQADLD